MMDDTKEAKSNKGSDKVEQIYEDLAKKIRAIYLPDYVSRLIREMYTLEEAKIAMELPAPAEEIAKKLNLDVKALEKKLDRMVRKGTLIKTSKGIRFPWFQEQFTDIMTANRFFDEERSEEFWKLLKRWRRDEKAAAENAKAIFQSGEGSEGSLVLNLRIIPRWKAIKDIPGVMPCEDIREILKEAEKTVKVNLRSCACRSTIRSEDCPVDEGTAPWEGNCITFGGLATYLKEVMKCTPYLTAEYILAHLDKKEKVPFYHQAPNSRVVGALCNCCVCDCGVRPMEKILIEKYNRRVIRPSRFLSVVDSNKCTAKAGCTACLSLCPWNALQLEGGTVTVDAGKCMGCGICVLNCPDEALKLKIVRPPEHIPEGGDVDIVNKLFTTPHD